MSIVVIGAGPAGLSLGVELQRRGLRPRLLEQAGGPGDTWDRIPRHWKTISPWNGNVLPGSDFVSHPGGAQLSRAQYHAYLRAYAEHHELRIAADTRVESVERAPGGGFVLRTDRGSERARWLVNATGYFSHPFLPEYAGRRDSPVPQLHVGDYREASAVAGQIGSGGRVLVIGKRISAGQLLVELVDAGFRVALSCRGPLRFGPPPWLLRAIFPHIPNLERLMLALGLERADTFARMEWGRARGLIRRGTVAVLPDVEAFEGRRIRFRDGSLLSFDLVVYATGFRPALDHLRGLVDLDPATGRPTLAGMESAAAPGLFFLGLDHLRNFQSRFLRGIRRDAAVLARVLERRCSEASSGSDQSS